MPKKSRTASVASSPSLTESRPKSIHVKSQDKCHHVAKAEYGMPSQEDLASVRAAVMAVSMSRASSAALDVPSTSSPTDSAPVFLAALQKNMPKKSIVVGPKVGTKDPLANPQASQTSGAGLKTRKDQASTGVNDNSVVVPPTVAGAPRAGNEISPTLRSVIERMTAKGIVAEKVCPGARAQTPVGQATSPQKMIELLEPFNDVPSASPSAVSKKKTIAQIL